jgi:spermidine synthase
MIKKYLKNDKIYEYIYLNINGIEPDKFSGSVLYLGMGTCIIPKLQSINVNKTTIVEIDENMIKFNKDNIKEDWIIINEDAYIFNTNEKFDFIFIDIFYEQTNKENLDILIDKYSKLLNENGTLIYLKNITK